MCDNGFSYVLLLKFSLAYMRSMVWHGHKNCSIAASANQNCGKFCQ